ncbi:DUF5324 family protein [Streptomyces cucumeris]|uniref:DUF5324 family protein n=1 Tax=Streptomyces cucumeris TaxID=2962890 RepID=UPI003D737CC9
MTRIDSVRAATGTAKSGVLHAAEAVAPYAGTAKDTATRYAHEARVRLAPKVSHAAHQARCSAGTQYHAHIAPRLTQARGNLPPKVDAAATRAAKRTRKAARQAADYTTPRVENAVAGVRAAAGPAREEAVVRTAAAVAALRTHVTAADIEKLARKRARRARAGRVAKRATFIGLIGAGLFAAWKWWDRQANPDWLVEPPAATEVGDRERLATVDGSDQDALDPEVQAKQAEAEARKDDDQR